MMRNTLASMMALLTMVAGGCFTPPAAIHAGPLRLCPPLTVTAYDLFDCGASQLALEDRSGCHLYLFNRPFRDELFLSAKPCTERPDLTCSVQITAGSPIPSALRNALEQAAARQYPARCHERIRKESAFGNLSKDEQMLWGTLHFMGRLEKLAAPVLEPDVRTP